MNDSPWDEALDMELRARTREQFGTIGLDRYDRFYARVADHGLCEAHRDGERCRRPFGHHYLAEDGCCCFADTDDDVHAGWAHEFNDTRQHGAWKAQAIREQRRQQIAEFGREETQAVIDARRAGASLHTLAATMGVTVQSVLNIQRRKNGVGRYTIVRHDAAPLPVANEDGRP